MSFLTLQRVPVLLAVDCILKGPHFIYFLCNFDTNVTLISGRTRQPSSEYDHLMTLSVVLLTLLVVIMTAAKIF